MIKNIATCVLLVLFFTSCEAKIKHAKKENAHIYGNCDMCKATIEKAGNNKGVVKVTWDKTSKQASIQYDSLQTTKSDILKKIALAGYDNEEFYAPDEKYNGLHACCQYDRKAQPEVKKEVVPVTTITSNQTTTKKEIIPEPMKDMQKEGLTNLYYAYVSLKDAFIKSNNASVSKQASFFIKEINAVDMNTLADAEHKLWMAKMNNLLKDANTIADTKDLEKQRKQFMSLSATMIELMKTGNNTKPIYVQHCPMYNDGKGANWLSNEKEVNNPYYGDQMLHCGNVSETIK
jgi:copper chaperone CopZ